jgi:hypothetical protein
MPLLASAIASGSSRKPYIGGGFAAVIPAGTSSRNLLPGCGLPASAALSHQDDDKSVKAAQN